MMGDSWKYNKQRQYKIEGPGDLNQQIEKKQINSREKSIKMRKETQEQQKNQPN